MNTKKIVPPYNNKDSKKLVLVLVVEVHSKFKICKILKKKQHVLIYVTGIQTLKSFIDLDSSSKSMLKA